MSNPADRTPKDAVATRIYTGAALRARDLGYRELGSEVLLLELLASEEPGLHSLRSALEDEFSLGYDKASMAVAEHFQGTGPSADAAVLPNTDAMYAFAHAVRLALAYSDTHVISDRHVLLALIERAHKSRRSGVGVVFKALGINAWEAFNFVLRRLGHERLDPDMATEKVMKQMHQIQAMLTLLTELSKADVGLPVTT